MGLWTLLEVALMPMMQLLLITMLGAFMATDYLNLLHLDARRSLNKILFMVFIPSLMFADLAPIVTLENLISWWFMPVNIALTFLFGGTIGWIAVKMLKLEPHLEGLFIATCSTGNMGIIMLVLIPAICKEERSPFGDHSICASTGFSYSTFSMAVCGFYLWTFSYQLMKSSAMKYKAFEAAERPSNEEQAPLLVSSIQSNEKDAENPYVGSQVSSNKLMGVLHAILKALMEPPTLGAIGGFVFGAIPWLRCLIIGGSAPLRVIQDTVKLLGDGTIPCVTLILGANLTQGLRSAKIKPSVILTLICVRFLILPAIGFGVVKAANQLGFLPPDPLYHFALMLQFTQPPAILIGTIAQMFEAGQEECSVLFLWTYLAAAPALTIWSTFYMWILS